MLGSILKAGLKDRSGAGALEFALVMPFFLGLLFAVYDLGEGLYYGAEVGHSAAKVARSLVANPNMTSDQVLAAIQAGAPDASPKAITASVTKQWVTSDAQVATLTWSYSYSTGLPFVPNQALKFGSTLVVPMAS